MIYIIFIKNKKFIVDFMLTQLIIKINNKTRDLRQIEIIGAFFVIFVTTSFIISAN